MSGISKLNNINFKIIDFGDQNNSNTLWTPPTSLEEIISWMGEARSEFNNLNIATSNRAIVIKFETMSEGEYGETRVDNQQEQGHVLRISNRRDELKSTMKTAIVHEYFHHAQKNTSVSSFSGNNILNNGVNNKRWILEGTASWFQDYLYDDIDFYKYFYKLDLMKAHYPLIPFFKSGFTKKGTGYSASMFWKLLSSKYFTFESNLKYLFYNNFSQNDPTTIKNVISVLEDSSCNFNNYVGNDNSILANAMLYYQYATTLENDITLLDSNERNETTGEKINFDFQLAKDVNKVDWNNLVDYIQDEERLGKNIIPKYGAYSFNLSSKDLKDINSSLFITAQTDNPLTIVGIHFDEDDNTVEDSDDSFYFTTEATKKITHTVQKSDIKGGIFLTLLNPTDKEVTISELKVESRFVRDDENNTIIDNKTNLMWDDTVNPILNWTSAEDHCDKFIIDSYTQWRLPTLSEMLSIVNPDAIRYKYYEDFKNLRPFGYWSDFTLSDIGIDLARYVHYGSGDATMYKASFSANVMCVRQMY